MRSQFFEILFSEPVYLAILSHQDKQIKLTSCHMKQLLHVNYTPVCLYMYVSVGMPMHTYIYPYKLLEFSWVDEIHCQ